MTMSSKSSGEGGEGSAISYTQLYGSKRSGSYTFHLTGLIELDYTDNTTTSSFKSIKEKSEETTFSQRVMFNAEGYIYNKNLITYMANISFGHDNTKNSEGAVDNSNAKYLTYSIGTVFFENRPVTLSLYASRTYDNYKSSLGPSDSVSNSYNVDLYTGLRGLPRINIGYSHWDYATNQTTTRSFFDEWEDKIVILETKLKTKTTTDMIDLNINGYLNSFLKTRYGLSFGLYRVSNPTRSYENLFVRMRTTTLLGKKNTISTAFQYAQLATSKLINFSSEYHPPPLKNLYHNYAVEYISSESTDGKSDGNSDSYSFRSSLRYVLAREIYARAFLTLKYGSWAGKDESLYKIDTSFHYSRPVIKFFNFDSQYGLSAGQASNGNELNRFLNNQLDMLIKTNKFKWGNIYAGLNISYNIFDYSSHATDNGSSGSNNFTVSQQRLIIGAKGNGPWRSLWFFELEARYLDSSSGNNLGAGSDLQFGSGDTQSAQKIRHYTAKGELRFSFLRTGRAIFLGSYITGQTNSQEIQAYNYEARLRYNITRRLIISAFWREEWRSRGWWNSGLVTNTNTEFTTPSNTRDYEFDLLYVWRKMTFTLEYASTRLDQNFTVSESKRLNFRASRRF